MTDPIMIEAVLATGANAMQFNQTAGTQAATAVADPSAVNRFQAAMAAEPVPFASEVAASWRSARANNQGIIHRIRALAELNGRGNVAAVQMVELQYEVMNLAFQQEVVTKVADKSSNAIQTLIKNQ